MAQFQVPQFIEVEERLIGPVTLRQFIYLAAAGGVCFILFFVLANWLWLFVAAFIMTAASVVAFVKVNGQPMTKVGVAAFFYFIVKPRMYVWRREVEEETFEVPEFKKPKREFKIPKPALGDLRSLGKKMKFSVGAAAGRGREAVGKEWRWAAAEAEKTFKSLKRPAPEKPLDFAPLKDQRALQDLERRGKPPFTPDTAAAAEPFILYQGKKEAFLEERRLNELKTGSGLKSIWQKILTAKEPIPKREGPLKPVWQKKEQFMVFQKVTGERGAARRVDYR